MKRLNVLYWVSPVVELDWPFQKEAWVRDFVPRIHAALTASFEVGDSLVCVSEEIKSLVDRKSLSVPGRIAAFSQRELLDDWTLDALAARRRFFATGETSRYYGNLARRFVEKIGGAYRPDVVFSFNESPFLRDLYPESVHLSVEHSVFSRPPYPRTFAFDPFSDGNSVRFLSSTMGAEMNGVKASPDDVAALRKLRTAIGGALTSNSAIAGYFSELRKTFDRLLLLPLGYDRYCDTLIHGHYSGHFEFVEHVLASADGKTGIVLTQHPTLHAIRPERIEELKSLHPNLRHEAWFGSVESFSQVALAYCDGCVVGSSSLAYQAAFLDKYLVSPDGFCKGIADATALSEVNRLYDRPPVNRDNYFAWVLNHYAVDADMVPAHLKALVENPARFSCGQRPDLENWPSAHEGVSLEKLVDKWIADTIRPFVARLAATRLVPKDFDLSSSAQKTVSELRDRVEAQQDELRRLFDDRDRIIADRSRIVADRDRIVADRDRIVADRDRVERELTLIAGKLDAISASRTYKVALAIRPIVDALLPCGSWRRRTLAKAWSHFGGKER